MINVEEWYLKMTENVQRTMDRLTGSFHKAKDVFTGTQERMKAGMDQVADSARQAQAEVDRTGHHVGGLFGKMKAGAGDWLGGLRKGWNEIFNPPKKMNVSANDARKMFNKDGKLDTAALKRAETARNRFRNYVDNLLPKGIGKAFKAGGMSGMAPVFERLTALAGPVGGTLAALVGPIAIAGAGMMAASKAYGAAKAFEPSARELRLTNMGKTPAQQAALRDQVVDLAGSHGFNAQNTATAFVQVQRISGQSTAAVNAFVGRVGQAAEAMNMDFVPMVAGSAKALKDFGLPLEQSTQLLDSNVKTMATARVGYAELAKAQEEYAGAAKLANQRVDAANSLYAVFAAHGADAEKAASNVVSTMEAMRSPSVIQGLKGIGVNVLDTKGQLRQIDVVARELVPRLAGMNEVKFARLKEQFSGSDGMVELLDMARGNSEKLLGTLDQFKHSELGISDQINAAKNDLDVAANHIEERWSAMWIRLGNAMRPVWQGLQQGTLSLLEAFEASMNPSAYVEQQAYQRAKDAAVAQQERVDKLAGPASTGTTEDRQRGFADLYRERKRLQDAFSSSEKAGLKSNAQRFSDQLVENQQAILKAQSAWGEHVKPKEADGLGTTKLFDKQDDPLKHGASAIVGGGKQVRNVNVTIQKLVEKLEVRTAGTVREGISNVRQQVEQALVDIVRGGEAALANG